MIRIDQHIQMRGMLGFESLNGHGTAADGLHIPGQLFGQLGVPQPDDLLEPRHLALFTDVGKQLAAFADLLDGLLEGNGAPLGWNRGPRRV